ncbi:MAG: Gfo/Idh/MocA family oxidoreductase [Chloroflexi bacterium]|nr:Gfo/Idh/MocA family oxidoreductase [Chloroflexota bacterium]
MTKVGVIGLGMGQAHLKGYSDIPDVEIVGIADIDPKRLATCAEQYKIAHAFSDYHDLLALPELEAVSVCLPNHLHAPVTIDALQAGRHVLVEKPMAKSVADAEAMLAAAQATGKTLAVSLNYRWSLQPESFYLKHLIESGQFGQIYYVRTQSLRRRTGVPATSWFRHKALSGGAAARDMGPHMLDLAMWLAGDYVALRVSGETRTMIMRDSDVDDFAAGLIHLQSGCTIMLESTWASFTKPACAVSVFGSEGGAILDLAAPKEGRLTLYGKSGDTYVETRPVEVLLPEPPEASIQLHFVNCLRTGRTPDTSAERGLAEMKVLDAIYASSEQRREIVLA